MDAMLRTAPPPGSANPGDLYVDLQSRTLWLGVDPAVDPAAFVLISDIVGLEASIDGAVVEAKAYTDTQIPTRAPLVHSHVSMDITDFTGAVTDVVLGIPGFNWARGMVMMYSGSLAEIGVGSLAGWALCDGSNGTPDLRDKFIIGAGTRPIGPQVSPPATISTTGGGTHVHTINGAGLTVAQLPAHNHGGITGYVSHNHTHNFSAVTDAQGNHAHATNIGAGDSGTGRASAGADSNTMVNTAVAGLHQHNVSGTTSGISENHYHAIPTEGSGQTHTHTIVGGGGIHEHNIPMTTLRDAIPNYALAFIMKL